MTNSLWSEDNLKVRKNESFENDGVIVFSKMDPAICDQSARDFVVMVELKYKENKGGSGFVCDKEAEKNSTEFRSTINYDAQLKSCLTDRQNTSTHSENLLPKQNLLTKESAPANSDPDKKTFECRICGRCFSRRTRLNSHMSRHTSIKPYKCDKCDKAYAMRWDLNAHKRIHSLAFVCHSCNKPFGSKSKLVRHTRVHTGERPFSCSSCGKAFGEKRNLENHIRAHTGDKPFSCTACGKTFGIKSHLKDHMSVHNKTLRFVCTTCNKSFKWKTNYNRHVKSHA